jgi:hypothetical protein
MFLRKILLQYLLPSVELLGLGEAVVPEDLDVAEHGLDGLLLACQLPLYLLAVVLRVLRVEVVDPLRLQHILQFFDLFCLQNLHAKKKKIQGMKAQSFLLKFFPIRKKLYKK